MIRYVWKEKVYFNEDAASDFARLAKALYMKIVDYQATLLIHMHQNPPRRWVRDVFKAGDWESRIQKIKELDLECKQLTDDIDAVRAQRWREDEQQWQQGLLQQHRNEKEKTNLQMLYSNYEAGKNANPIRVSGTCEWFLRHPDFLSWRQSQCSSLLWLSADPGCGKSVLSKYLTDCKGEVLSLNPGISMICYFSSRMEMLIVWMEQRRYALCYIKSSCSSPGYMNTRKKTSSARVKGFSLTLMRYGRYS